MNEPIISPVIIYLIGVATPMQIFSLLLGVTVGVLAMLLSIHSADCHKDSDEQRTSVSTAKKCFVLSLVLGFITVVIPSQETIYKMIAAKHATPNNINKIIESGKDIKNSLKADVLDIIKSFGEEKDD